MGLVLQILEELSWKFVVMLFQRLPKTFVRCALERRVLDSRTVPFIVSFPASCVKEVTLLIIMALVVNLYMVTNSRMKILPLSTLVQVYYLWQTLVQTLMDRNFFFAQPKLIGLMASMWFLVL